MLPEDILNELKMANIIPSDREGAAVAITYAPTTIHWFYKRLSEGKQCWLPFTQKDSDLLEESFKLPGKFVFSFFAFSDTAPALPSTFSSCSTTFSDSNSA